MRLFLVASNLTRTQCAGLHTNVRAVRLQSLKAQKDFTNLS